METAENNTPAKKGFLRKLMRFFLWFAVVWAALLLLLQIVLSTSVLTRTVNRIGADYVDGDLSFGRVSVNMFRNFPNISLTLDDVSITYPADRFDVLEKAGAQGDLLYHGTGESADTLVSFERFSVSLNIAALATGSINIPHMRLTKPRVFAHSYDKDNVNWDMFRFSTSEEEEDTTGFKQLPDIVLGRISLSGKPHIVYTDSKNTIFTMIDVGRASFNGKLSNRSRGNNRLGLSLEEIFIAGRAASDTLAFRLDDLHIHEHDDHIDIDAGAEAILLTSSYGRMNVPISIGGTVAMPKDSIPYIYISGMAANVGNIPFEINANIGFGKDKTYLEGMVEIKEWQVNDALQDYVSKVFPEIKAITTDANVSFLAACFGAYDHTTGRLPSISASLSIPESYISHEDLDADLLLAMEANIYNTGKRITLEIPSISMNTSGLDLSATGKADDLLGEDPVFSIDGRLDAALDSLTRFLPDSLGLEANGNVSAMINGSTRLSQLDIYSFSYSDLLGELRADDISVRMPKDTLSAVIKGMEVRIAPEDRTSRRDSSQTFRMLGISAEIAEADIDYKESMSLAGRSIAFSAKNSATNIADSTKRKIGHFGGRLTAGNLMFKDVAATSVEVEESANAFQMIPKRDNPEIPVLTVTSDNGRINLNTGINRVILADSRIRMEAAMNSVERRQGRAARLDSLAEQHPEASRDSLMLLLNSRRQIRTASEEPEDDFRDMDIDIRLDETLARYFREWDIDGSLDVDLGLLMTPYFPIENYVEDLKISFNNNEVGIDNIRLEAGESLIEANGKVSGLRRALTARNIRSAPIRIGLDISSPRMNANELLTAYNTGLSFDPESLEGKESISDEDFFEQVVTDSVSTDQQLALLVVPSNIIADISVSSSDMTYSDISIDNLAAKITARDRCVQITEAKAETNIGRLGVEGFYATRSKTDIKAGFDLSFKDITADKVISLMPAVDTMIPMLKSFKGLLDCEVAATASLDTAMSIIPSSINGVMRIGGRDMTISGDKDFSKIADLLKFKNRNEGKIDRMTVEGIIRDNTLEVFPFVIQVDRYTMALSGIQNLDMSFRYHVSMIKSPMLFRFGVDLYGQDFDNLKFRLGKAKYKNANVPVFSSEIDKTRIDLVSSIRNIFEKGVDKAISEHQKQEAITEHKKNIGYVEAIDMEMEELSEAQKIMIQGEQ